MLPEEQREDSRREEAASNAREVSLVERNCAAKIAQHKPVQKRQHATLSSDIVDAKLNTNTSQGYPISESLLVLSIGCENLSGDTFGDRTRASEEEQQDVSANLYLYKRQSDQKLQLVRHLVEAKGFKSRETFNASLALNLDHNDSLFKQLTLREFQREHVIVISFDNSIDGSPLPQITNITIGFIDELNHDSDQRKDNYESPLPIDRFPRTSEYGKWPAVVCKIFRIFWRLYPLEFINIFEPFTCHPNIQ